jgi:dATP pyrophosphohydrolase
VLVIICTDDREVLLLRRVAPFSFWQSVTGTLEWGETAATAAAREVAEETGISMPGAIEDCKLNYRFQIDPRWRHKYAPDTDENLEHVFRLRLPGRVGIRLSAREHDKSEWVPLGEAIERVWSWSNQEALEALV